MIYFIWLTRILHIGAGVFWVGGTLMTTYLIGPTVGATGEAGQKFIGHLMGAMKFSNRMSIAAGTTVLAGAILFWIDSDGFTSPWLRSGAGKGFSLGAGFAIIGFVFGILVGRTMKSMGVLGTQIQGRPTDEQMTQLATLRRQQVIYSNTASIALILAVIFMALARYFVL